MKKIVFIVLSVWFLNVSAQEKKYEVATIGFYNLENLFDRDSSMQITNVDKLNANEPGYTYQKDFDADEYYNSLCKSQIKNLNIMKSKLDFEVFPLYPTSGLVYEKLKLKDYNEEYDKDYTKKEFKTEIEQNESLLSKKEFKALVKNNDSIRLDCNELYWKVNDKENTPKGKRQYTEDVYNDKLLKLASVISDLGKEYSKDGVALLGLAEIENRKVLDDLTQNDLLKKQGLDIEHYDCMYSRGVDVALLYQPKYFEVVKSHTIVLPYFIDKKKQEHRYFTRDILWVEGKLLGETVHVFVNHWPSRRGGETKSSYGRELGAQMCKNVIDSLMQIDPNTQVIVMGDFNDDPTNKSVKTILGASKNRDDVQDGGMYNPLYKDYKKGYGSLGYRGSWNLFDQIIVSSSFVNNDETWSLQDAEIVYNQDWINRFGGYEGGPNRSFGGNYYQGGYSDHLPSLVYLKRKPLNDKDKDGIADKDDDCPETAGIEAFNGCPDSDEDGIMDKEDDCPNTKGLAALNGCPDSDGDGVKDKEDNCPNEAGPKENKGCPYADRDNDGVLDKDDKCPETKGLKENDGCPELKEDVKKAVKDVFDNLVFDTGKATIRKSSDDELEKLAEIMRKHPELLLTIEGHTDNVGNDDFNMTLSKNRAQAVKARLMKLGVERDRITDLYFGETKPIASNATAAGRQKNRRVEFIITSK